MQDRTEPPPEKPLGIAEQTGGERIAKEGRGGSEKNEEHEEDDR